MATDYRVKVGFLEHPKTRRLKKLAGPEAVLAFMQLWEFCALTEGRGDGNLCGLDEDDIEYVARWQGANGALVHALREVGFLDEMSGELGYCIHEFAVHNEFVAGSDARRERARQAGIASGRSRRGLKDQENTEESSRTSSSTTRSTTSSTGSSTNGSTKTTIELNSIHPSNHPTNHPSIHASSTPSSLTVGQLVERVQEKTKWTHAPSTTQVPRLEKVLPVPWPVLEESIEVTMCNAAKPNWAYLVSVLESERKNRDEAKEQDDEFSVDMSLPF